MCNCFIDDHLCPYHSPPGENAKELSKLPRRVVEHWSNVQLLRPLAPLTCCNESHQTHFSMLIIVVCNYDICAVQ